MGKPAFTPGPWDVGPNCKTIRPTSAVVSPHQGQINGGFIIAELFGSDLADNARLIGAAPEMHSALAEAREWIADLLAEREAAYAGYETQGSIPEIRETLASIDAALAKASA